MPNDHEAWCGCRRRTPSPPHGGELQGSGWPARITGARYGQIENLLVREIDDDGVRRHSHAGLHEHRVASASSRASASSPSPSAPNSAAAYIHARRRPTCSLTKDLRQRLHRSRDRPPPSRCRSAVRAACSVHPCAVQQASRESTLRKPNKFSKQRHWALFREGAAGRPLARGHGQPRRRGPSLRRGQPATLPGRVVGRVHLPDAEWLARFDASYRVCRGGPAGLTSRS